MLRRYTIVILIQVLIMGLMVCTGSAQAGSFYTGAEIGYASHRFKPEYDYTYDRPNSGFVNMAYGSEIGWIGGYRFNLNDQIAAGVQGRFGINTAEWSVDTPSPSQLNYRISPVAVISFQPDIAVTKTLSLMLEAGIGQGLIKEKKDAPSSSRYDFSDWTTGYLAGVGLKYHFVAGVSFFVMYRYMAYDKIDYQTFLPDGTHWETVSDRPSSTTISLGFSWDIGH